ncbi:hypothetical protein FC50_GL001617 [Lacticaseibacillus pantheris DSM 15945 = JCM 12539 = NBRC 106106]|uniref:RNase H type-1 domain-containing protein n=1 Tax=Lacticaseibacillus pantheris DSM 15945 = JCM 12539 = NBRC 106106 TaxID=1423783 RepID=A0A0R1TW55_9LACO|nr:ribonuclease HI family protein [Lacticaseibacillus pantheris]KRL85452.1 hypothetical protein FC50_GL001617 [Lacticaseibacillus pantheris DSM 15945 = JCM 12539 = NBRC 106106]
MLKLYTDAATKGNPGPSGAGILIVGHGEPVEQSVALPVMSNHQAEFRAAALGLEAVINQGWQDEQVTLITDSQIVVDALDKQYAKHFAAEVTAIVQLADQIKLVIPTWRNDHSNRRAHELAQVGLHAAEKRLAN